MLKDLSVEISKNEKEIQDLSKKINVLRESFYKPEFYREGIRGYLGKLNNVLIKILKLSNNYLIIKDGRIYYREEISILSYNKNAFADDLEKVIKACNDLISKMSNNGVSIAMIQSLARCLLTIYHIYDNLDSNCKSINNEISAKIDQYNSKIEELEDEIKNKKAEISNLNKLIENNKRKFKSGPIEMSNSYNNTAITLGIYENGADLVWNINDGLLLVKSYNNEELYQFIKTTLINFVYSFPKANAKILYCSNKKNDEMNRFFIKITNEIEDKIFFNGISSVTSSEPTKLQNIFKDVDSLINERTTTISQSDCDTVLEYNKKNPEYAIPNILIVLNDYPNCYRDCRELEYFFENSKKYGIHFLIIQTRSDLKKNDYNDEKYDNPNDYAALILENNGNNSFICNNKKCDFVPIAEENYSNLIAIIKDFKSTKKVVSFEDIGFGNEATKPEEVNEYISIPVGKADNNDYSIEFAVAGTDDKPIAYFVIGDPSKGKSSLIDSMIFNGCMKYSPDDLNFYLIDFKDGISSAMYTNNARMPHIKVVAQHSRQEDAEIILQTIINEQSRRNAIFAKYNTQNLADYNKLATKHLPRIIIVIDEVSVMFKEDSTDNNRTDRLVSQCEIIARQGRSSGIHLVLASQSIENKMNKIIDFINGRVCFYATNDDYISNTLCKDDIKRIRQECNEPGVALVKLNKNSSSTRVKFAYYNKKEVDYSRAINNRWSNYPINIAIIGDDSVLNYSLACENSSIYTESLEGAAIGQNFYNHQIEYLPFDDYHHSMVVLGEQYEIHTSILTSIAIYASKFDSVVKLVDESKEQFMYKSLKKYNKIDCYTGDDYLEVLKSAYDEFMLRYKNKRENYKPYYLIINDIQDIVDFVENNEYNQDNFIQDGYVPLSMINQQLNQREADKINGYDTLFKMLNSISLVSNFYICFSLKKISIIQPSTYDKVANCDYKICHYPFDSSMGNIFGREYNQKLASSCSEGIILLSKKQNPLEKIRYFNYENNSKTLKLIDKEMKNNEN